MRFHFVGPVCWYDMLRMARRARYFLLRGLYALLLVVILCLMYGSTFGFFDRHTQPKRMTEFGEVFFNVFMVVQYFLALVLTPAYVAGAVAEEKERKTLEFVLATDLQGQEIVFSKLVSRLGNLILFLLAGLPVLSLVQLFGGVSPTLLWCGFAVTGMAVLSAACLSILLSVYVRRARDAIVRTTMLLFGYFVLGFLLWWLLTAMETSRLMGAGRAAAVSLPEKGLYETAFGWFFEIVMSGHIVYVLVRLFSPTYDPTGLGWSATPLDLLRNFASFHGAFAVLFLGWACWRLRAVFIKQNYGTPLKAKERRGWFRRRPPVGEHPVLWKERFVEASARMTKGAIAFYVLCFIFSMAPLGFIVYFALADGWRSDSDSFRQSMNIYVRIAGTVVACLLLLGVGVRAASSVGSERDRQTLESLLSSPLTLREILAGKWFGSLLGSRPMFFLLLFIWGLGMITGGLHVAAPVVLLAVLAAYGAFIASLGLYFSVSSKTTNRAMLWTVGITLLWGGLHWVCCGWPLMLAAGFNESMGFFLLGETPPAVLFIFAFGYSDVDDIFRHGDKQAMMIMFCVLGVFVAAGAALLLWGAAQQRFLAISGRIPPGYWPRRSPLATLPEEV